MKNLTVSLVIGFVLAGQASLAGAQDFPNKPVRMIVAYPPGSGPDLISRAVGNAMTGNLGQPIVIENRAGSGGVLAIQELTRAAPDGYTLFSADAAHWAIYPALRPGVYDPQKDMAPVALINTGSYYMIVQDSFPARNLQEFIAVVKANPGKFSYGSSGIGTVQHLAVESFDAALGLSMLHIPFKGSAQQVAALLGGQISIMVAGTSSATAQLKSGQLRLIAGTAAQRTRAAPNIPSIAEAQAGLAELDFRAEGGYFVPSGTPKAIIEKLAAGIQRAADNAEVIRRIEGIGLEVQFGSAEQLANVVRGDVARYAKAVKISGAKID